MSYGDESYGVLAYGEAIDLELDSDAFLAFLSDVSRPRCWVLALDHLPLAAFGGVSAAYGDAAYGEQAYGEQIAGVAAGVETRYFSSHGYTSHAADSPANRWFDGRLSVESVERRIIGRAGVGGLARNSARVTLANADGALDTLRRDYALDGRTAVIYVGDPEEPFASFGRVFTGVVDAVGIGLGVVTFELSDGASRFDTPINTTLYAGSGGLEGGDDLKGKAKPRCWGHVYNVPPPLVDSAALIYQLNDGAISDVPACYDRGVSLTKGADYSSQSDMTTTAPSAGQYRVWKGGGFFRLGATPAGQVTCDALGDASGAGYVDKTADIVLRLLAIVSLTSDQIDPTSFSNLNSNAGAEVGLWVLDKTVGAAIDELLAGVGAYGGFSRFGAFTVALIALPTGAAEATFEDDDILGIEIEPISDELEPIVWRVDVGWRRNYTVQEDLAASVSAAQRTFAAQAERVESVESATILSQRRLARIFAPLGELYAQQADAADEAQRRFDLWSVNRTPLKAQLPLKALVREIGKVVTLKHARLGLAAGLDCRVLGQRITPQAVELKGFG